MKGLDVNVTKYISPSGIMEVVGDMVDVIIDVLCEVTVSEVVVWVFVDVQGDVVVVELDEISQNSPVHSGGQTQFILPNKNEQNNFFWEDS